jgi:hypothetical protein
MFPRTVTISSLPAAAETLFGDPAQGQDQPLQGISECGPQTIFAIHFLFLLRLKMDFAEEAPAISQAYSSFLAVKPPGTSTFPRQSDSRNLCDADGSLPFQSRFVAL